MDQDEYVLFVDETGTAHPKDTASQYYILSGCVVREGERHKLRQVAQNIKYKYWNDPDIVFHSYEIGRKVNSFSMFKSSKLYGSFLDDLENDLFKREFNLLYVLVDKTEAQKRNWDDKKIYKDTSKHLLESFLCFLLSRNARGKIVIESATTEKDSYFLKSLSLILSQGVRNWGISHAIAKQVLTSISFVSKNNFDTEEQLADIFAYAAKCHYMEQSGIKNFPNRYEKLVMKTLASKLITKAKSPVVKAKFAKHLASQVRLP